MEENHRGIPGVARFTVEDLEAVNVCVFVFHGVEFLSVRRIHDPRFVGDTARDCQALCPSIPAISPLFEIESRFWICVSE
jgi:hypothetical protein